MTVEFLNHKTHYFYYAIINKVTKLERERERERERDREKEREIEKEHE